MDLNTSLFQLVYGAAHQTRVLDVAGVFLAGYLQYALCGFLLALLCYPRLGRSKHQTMVLLAALAAVIARWVLKPLVVLLYAHPRPFVELASVKPLVATNVWENFQSFPSGHALFFFALGTVLYLFNRRLGAWYLGAAAVMGLARIYVGVHWPVDVLGGAVIGTLVGWTAYAAYRKQRA